ncbi:MAG: hypothetical protein HZA31_12915 [Opitutae bacterium]|nr:hypothetical protein [Opitutae bacterium]
MRLLTRSHARPSLCLALFAGLLFSVPAAAQRPGNAGPAMSDSASLTTAYSANTTLERSGANLGDVSVTALQFSWNSALPLGAGQQFGYGLDYQHYRLQRGTATPLPGELRGLSVPLMFAGTLAPDWSGRLLLRPGIYGSSLTWTGRHTNVPVLALVSFRQSPELAWSFGVRYDAWAQHPVLPFAGVNWKFAPDWEFAVGMPRTGVTWQCCADLAWRLGASMQGGSFYVESDPRPAGSTAPALGSTRLDYREIRIGTGVDYTVTATVSLSAEAGVIANQRFDYHQRHYRLAGDTAAYAALSLRARF